MYDEQILRELPQEFQGKENIEILVRAFARQLDELYAASAQLKKLCDIDSVQGKQLDGIGDIVVLSRSDAMRLIKGPITYDIMDDEHYRHYLRYKILKNTSTCTYYDIIMAVQMLWGADDVEYFENPEEPATVTLTFPDPGGAVQLDDIPPVVAAGVGIHIRAKSLIHMTQKIFAGSCLGVHETQAIKPLRFARCVRQKLFSGTASAVNEKTVIQPYDRPRRLDIETGMYTGSRTGVLEILRINMKNTAKTVTHAPPFFVGRHLVIHETVTIRPWKKEMMTVDNCN